MKIFGILLLCLHVLSSKMMDSENSTFGSDADAGSKCKRKECANKNRYVTVAQSLESYKDPTECDISKCKNKNQYKIKEDINYVGRRNVEDLDKTDAEINNFLDECFPSYYHTYKFSTQGEIGDKERLGGIEESVSEAVATGNQTKLKESYSEYILLLATYGPTARLYITIAECMAQMARMYNSKPTFDSTMNLLNEVTILTELDTSPFTIVAKRRIAFLSLRGDFNHAISVHKILVEQFPQNLHELKKLAEIQFAFSHTLDVLDVFERMFKLDSSNQFTTAILERMKYTTASTSFTKMLKKLEDLKKKLQKSLYTNDLNNNNDNINSDSGISNDLEDGRDLIMTATRSNSPAIVRRMCTKNEGLWNGALFNYCGEELRRLGRYVEADTIFERAAKDGLFRSFWQRSPNFINGLTAKPIWNMEQTGIAPSLYQLQSQWKNIREEAFGILKRNLFKPQPEGIATRGKWGVYNLYNDGIRIEENCLNAPLTCSLIENIPQISNSPQIRGCVTFSHMEAGTHASSHAGPSNAKLRIHLGLNTPPRPVNVTSTANSPCKARVANEYFTWEDGQMDIFDDSFDHEVWQLDPLKRPRLILMMDMVHPELMDQHPAILY